MMAEQKIPPVLPPAQVADWFMQHPPLSLVGFYRLIETQDQLGLTEQVQNGIRARWVEGDFSR